MVESDESVGSSFLSSGSVTNDKPTEDFPEDPEPEAPAEFMDDHFQPRSSFHSWTEYSENDPPISPNRVLHESWNGIMGTLKARFEDDRYRKKFGRYIINQRGEDESDSTFGRMWNRLQGR